MEVPVAVRGVAPGAAYGWLIGSIAGLGEAALARSSSLDDGLLVFGWAALLDGAVGAALGAIVGLALLSGKGRGWRGGVAAGAITVGAACAVGFSEGVEVRWPARETALQSGRDIVIVALDKLDPASVESMPSLRAFGSSALGFPAAFASAPERDGALAALLTGRLLPGQRDQAGGPGMDVPDLAKTLGTFGYRSAAILQGDGAAERRWASSFDTVVGVGAAHLLGRSVPTSRLALVNASASWFPRPSERAATAADAAVAALRTPTDGSSFLLVELADEAGAVALDKALQRVLEAVDARPNPTLVLVVGLRGAAPAPGDLRRSALESRAWVRLPGRSFAGMSYLGGVTSADWFAPLLRWAWVPAPDAADLRTDLDQRLITATPPAQAMPAADLPPGDPEACNVSGYWTGSIFERPSWSKGDGGVSRVMRNRHYAYVLDAKGKEQLFDDVRDPEWKADLLAQNAPTCGETLASARAASERAKVDAAWSASEAHAGVKLPSTLAQLPPAAQDPIAAQ